MTTRRYSETVRTTVVEHVAKPTGRSRENGPHLSDLRTFVEKAAGLPDDLLVRISDGHVDGTGRHDVTITVRLTEKVGSLSEPEPEAADS